MFASYIGQNFIALFALLGLSVFLKFNGMLKKRYTDKFAVILIVCAFLVIIEILEMYEQTLPEVHFGRFLSSGLSYALRPIVMILIGYSLVELTLKQKILIAIPGVINAVCAIISIFVPIMFDFTDGNDFIGTCPLHYMPHIVGTLYLVGFIICAIILFYKKKHANTLILLVIFIAVAIALLIETFSSARALTSAIVLSVVMYYVYLLTVSYRLDSLTGALTRGILYLDADSKFAELTAVIMLDLNGLKALNDSGGHVAGDTALVSIAESCRANLEKDCNLYRIGGDEFVILCFNKSRDSIVPLVDAITATMAKTPYSASIGYAYKEENDTFDTISHRADTAMYKNKQLYKTVSDIDG